MSDFNPFLDEGESSPPDDGPDDGVASGDGQPTDQTDFEEVPKEYLPDDYADRYVRVKVDGEETEVPLHEALQGYSRTADYTRKTQELAAQRQQAEYALTLQRALQTQPAATLRLLSEQYGIPLGQSPPPQAGAPSYDDEYEDDEDPYQDPVERRLAEQQKVIDQLAYRDQRREADQLLQRAIGGLQRKYNLDQTTVNEVVSAALQSRAGPEQFETIYKSLAFDRAQQARAAAQAQRAEQEGRRQAAGQRAGQLIGNGASANSAGAPMVDPSEGKLSISDAYDMALKEHGVG